MEKSKMEEIEKKIQTEVDACKQTQREYGKALINRQQLDGQLNETTAVKEELDLLKSGNDVYKLIGPVLMKQDLEEAKQDVNIRINFITNKLKRVDTLITDLSEKQDNHREKLDKLRKCYE